MATSTARRKPRTIRLVQKETGENPAIVKIVANGKAALYHVREIENELGNGRAFDVREDGQDRAYQCITTGEDQTCDCAGFARWNRCKHVQGLFALVVAGRI
jgi:hypothetical protein